MKAAIISLGSKSSQLQLEAMQKYFDQVDALDIREVEVNLSSEKIQAFHKGEPIAGYDCVYTKGSYKYASIIRSIITAIQHSPETVYQPLKPSAITTTHNKFLTQLRLQEHKIPMPAAYLAPTGTAVRALLEKVNYPIVIKMPEGTQGKGVMFAESYAAASALIDALDVLKQPFIIQEYIETGGTDVRAIVVGDKVVAAMKRKAEIKEIRSNIHSGGEGEACTLDTITKKIAVRTAQAIGAEVCGVDIIEGPKGPLVLEANISPGMKIQEITKIDVADKIAKHFAKQTEAMKGQAKTTGTKEMMAKIELGQTGKAQEIITHLDFRGERILLPNFANKIAGFEEKDEVTIKVSPDKIDISKFKI